MGWWCVQTRTEWWEQWGGDMVGGNMENCVIKDRHHSCSLTSTTSSFGSLQQSLEWLLAVPSGSSASSPSQQLPPPHPRPYLFILHSTIKIKFLIGSPNYRATQQNKTTSIRIIGKDACPWNVCCRHGYYYCPLYSQSPRIVYRSTRANGAFLRPSLAFLLGDYRDEFRVNIKEPSFVCSWQCPSSCSLTILG